MLNPEEQRDKFKSWLKANIFRLWDQVRKQGRYSYARFGSSNGYASDMLLTATGLYLSASDPFNRFWDDEEMYDISCDVCDYLWPD